MTDQKIKNQFVLLRASGETFKGIAKQLNVPETDLIEWSKQHKEEIGNLKAILFEEKESVTFTKRSKRVEVLQTLAERIRDEIASRDLKDVPTDKLLALFPKLTHSLKDEEREVRFEKTTTTSTLPGDFDFSTTTKEQWNA